MLELTEISEMKSNKPVFVFFSLSQPSVTTAKVVVNIKISHPK